MTYNLWKGYIFLFLNTTLILYASLIFNPLTPTVCDLKAGPCTDGLFPVLSLISGLIFATCLHFTHDFTSSLGGQP